MIHSSVYKTFSNGSMKRKKAKRFRLLKGSDKKTKTVQ